MATRIECPFPGCEIITENADKDLAIAIFNAHVGTHTVAARVPNQASKSEKLQRPRISQGMLEEGWNSFKIQWEIYKEGTKLQADEVSRQLIHCCEQDVMEQVLRTDAGIAKKTEEVILKEIKKLAVVPVAMGVRRADLLGMKQDKGEQVRSYASKIQGKSATCAFKTPCGKGTCDNEVEFTDIITKYVLVNGLEDDDVKRETLGWKDLDTGTLGETIEFIEQKEMARDALKSDGVAAVKSEYKKNKDDPRLKKKTSCESCGEKMNQFGLSRFGKVTERKLCPECWKSRKTPKKDSKKEDDEAAGFFLDAISVASIGSARLPGRKAIELKHHIFDDYIGWTERRSAAQPTLNLRLEIEPGDYTDLGIHCPRVMKTQVSGVTDTGAQSCLWGLKEFYAHGFKKTDLIPVKQRMYAANRQPIEILGAIVVRLSGTDKNGKRLEAPVIVYISPDTSNFYVSRQALIALRIITPEFPRVGEIEEVAANNEESFAKAGEAPKSFAKPGEAPKCGCLPRTAPPKRPDKLPFPATVENIPKMKNWMFDRFASSTFNKCPHQPLPFMEGDPIKLHVDPDATPKAVHTAIPVPLHWRDQVREDLQKDVRLGVIEPVPAGEPTRWQHRMIITSKENGEPRRVVDLSPLNKHCLRETFSPTPAAKQARLIPPNTWKTCTDAWNGFHSALIVEEDRHLTTFITEEGRFRYRVAPQGYLSSGDGYNQRYDKITQDVDRKTRCTDDTALWDEDEDLELHWWRVLDYLQLMGENGIVLNKDKFQFCSKTIDFAGFRVTEKTVEPLPKYIESILNFPTPTKIADVRSWYGLVNQVAHYAQLRDIVAPLRPLLSSKTKFYWNDDLQECFDRSKGEIVSAIKRGVEIFEPGRRTCLRTDYSKVGLGYFLTQKHCDCVQDIPGCCQTGWRITTAGSRFLKANERGYSPVEGECLGIVWALEQTRFFTLGSKDFVVVTDHQPIVKLFGDRTLDEISNPRLLKLKERTFPWKFETVYLPGKGNFFADARSRNPVWDEEEDCTFHESAAALLMGGEDESELWQEEVDFEISVAAMGRSLAEDIEVVSWDDVKRETVKDEKLMELKNIISRGFPEKKAGMPETLVEYWECRNQLWVTDDVIMYGKRIMIPLSLRKKVLEVLGSAHQGETAMGDRARDAIYWPGISKDIAWQKKSCTTCWENAPSQPNCTPVEPYIPSMPFEAIVSDFFQLKGFHYLIIGDRLSAWTETIQIKVGSNSSGAKGLCTALRQVFCHFGVPEEISSDGGPEYEANATKAFLKKWKVRHRMSSAYMPSSNGRAELAVKAAKRLLKNNVGPDGSLDTDKYVRAILMKRNTPDPITKLSPAEILMGRKLSDALPRIPKNIGIMESEVIRPVWREGWKAKEEAMRARFVLNKEELGRGSKDYKPLSVGDQVILQNQNGRFPTKWDRSGVVDKIICRPKTA